MRVHFVSVRPDQPILFGSRNVWRPMIWFLSIPFCKCVCWSSCYWNKFISAYWSSNHIVIPRRVNENLLHLVKTMTEDMPQNSRRRLGCLTPSSAATAWSRNLAFVFAVPFSDTFNPASRNHSNGSSSPMTTQLRRIIDELGIRKLNQSLQRSYGQKFDCWPRSK